MRIAKIILILSTVVIFGVAIGSPISPSKPRAIYIHPSADQTSETTLHRIAQFGVSMILVDIYYPTGVGKGVFLAEKKGPWKGKSAEPEFASVFSLDRTIKEAEKLGISVHATIACFGELPAIDPTNEAHREHVRDVAQYVVQTFPSVSGIHLDFVRYMAEWGLNANGNADTITSFVRSVRDVTRGKELSAAVIAAADQEEYDRVMSETGQDWSEISEYLDFICPMAYHLAFGKSIEWIGSASQFASSIVVRSCKVLPSLQAYYQFETDMVVERKSTGARIPGPSIEVPSVGVLRLDITWRRSENHFSLHIKDRLLRGSHAYRIVSRFRHSSGESYVIDADAVGVMVTELEISCLPGDSDVVTIHVSDSDEEFPGYETLRAAISLAVTHADGFCIYALNNLSPRELQAIGDFFTSSIPSSDGLAFPKDQASARSKWCLVRVPAMHAMMRLRSHHACS